MGGGMGAVIAIPFLYGKTLGRAVDQAARQALTDLFLERNEIKPFPYNPVIADARNQLDWH